MCLLCISLIKREKLLSSPDILIPNNFIPGNYMSRYIKSNT